MAKQKKVRATEAVEAFLKERTLTVKPHTVNIERMVLGQMLDLVGRSTMLHRISREDMVELVHGTEHGWASGRRKGNSTRPLAASTREQRRGVLRRFFRYCQDTSLELAEIFPMHNVKHAVDLVRPTPRPNGWRRLSLEEIETTFDAAPHPRDRMLAAFVALTGVRKHEIHSRRLEHFNLEQGYYLARLGKKKKEQDRVVEIPISPWLREEIDRWLSFYESVVGELKPDMFFIPFVAQPFFVQANVKQTSEQRVIDPYRPYARSTPMFRKILATVGVVEEGEGSHTYRRSIARLVFDGYRKQGMGDDEALVKTKEFLNHSSIETTLGYIGTDGVRAELHDEIRNGKLPIWQARATQNANVLPFRRGPKEGAA